MDELIILGLKFQTRDEVFVLFNVRGELNLRYVGAYENIEKLNRVGYRLLDLPNLNNHNGYHNDIYNQEICLRPKSCRCDRVHKGC